ncbi:MAG TPA: class I SAM-dependent methyltransferase [Thermodesulfobacteriota bacterium]|nr:class I SAM-dependent methyltransferase [Thermodesulfobacteriota bacterium]
MPRARADRVYWDGAWAQGALPAAVDPRVRSVKTYPERALHRYFERIFSTLRSGERRLLEIGCARSAWLPYFAKVHGFQVTGIDYSEVGCRQAREILAATGADGTIVCADVFRPPPSLSAGFDVVVSFGVVEHYEDTAGCVRALAGFARPGGLVVTLVPNLAGLVGLVQRVINRPVFDRHVVLDREALRAAHEGAGLSVVECDYFLFTHFGVCNLLGLRPGTVGWAVKRGLLGALCRASMAVWGLEMATGPLRANRLTSPYVICTARRD